MIFFGIILLLVAVGCWFAARSQAGRLRAFNAADTFTAQMLTDLYNRVVPTLGGEALAQPCEVAGTIEADTLLAGPLSNSACVAYTYTVTREYEEDVTTTDEHGKTKTETAQRSETASNDERRTRFYVRDATGRVLIDPTDAEIDLVDSGTRFDPTQGTTLTRTRTLGHRHQEQSLAVGTQVYILGCVVDGQNQPMIARSPKDHKQKFIISRRSERELAGAAASAARYWYYGASGAGALGIVLLVIGIVA
ncbi:MAG: GIDE domain-containing protein [Roseiflexaceae bacterium]